MSTFQPYQYKWGLGQSNIDGCYTLIMLATLNLGSKQGVERTWFFQPKPI